MDDSTLAALVREVAKRELGEDDEIRGPALEEFRDWIVKNPNIRNCRTDDVFLLAFLRYSKFNINNAKQTFISFLKLCQKLSEVTSNLDVRDSGIDLVCSQPCMYLSPFRDEHGRSIFINHPGALDLNNITYIDHGRTMFTMFFNLMNESASQVLGYVHILDLRGYGVTQATFWPLRKLVGLMRSFEKALPYRHKEIHIISMNFVVKMLFNLFIHGASQKMKDRVYIHDTLEDLHKKVSPEVLPKEYGGQMPAKEMCALWKQKMIQSRDLVLGMSDMQLRGNGDNVLETKAFQNLDVD